MSSDANEIVPHDSLEEDCFIDCGEYFMSSDPLSSLKEENNRFEDSDKAMSSGNDIEEIFLEEDDDSADIEEITSIEERDPIGVDSSEDHTSLIKLLDERLRESCFRRSGKLLCPHENCKTQILIPFLRKHLLTHNIDLRKEIFTKIRCLMNTVLGHMERYNSDEVKRGILMSCMSDGCGAKFTSETKLRDHVNSTHTPPVRCTFKKCGRFMSPADMKVHIETAHNDEIKCPRCNIELAKKFLNFHLLNYCGKLNFYCPVEKCGAAFKSEAELTAHNGQVHKQLEIECPRKNCFIRIRPSFLNQHLEKYHDRPKATCYNCKGRVSFPHLKAHLMKCSKIFCAVTGCKSSFPDKYSLRKHVAEVHKSNLLLIECPYENCNSFVKNWELVSHVALVHKDTAKEKCGDCGNQIPILDNQAKFHKKNCIARKPSIKIKVQEVASLETEEFVKSQWDAPVQEIVCKKRMPIILKKST